MKTTHLTLVMVGLLACARSSAPSTPTPTPDIAVWREFVSLLRAAPFPPERIQPLQEPLREANLRVLALMRSQAHWSEWTGTPEVLRNDGRIHYLLPLTFGDTRATYSFSFVLDGDRWFLQHIEGIQLRLDRVGEPPVSVFPDLPEETKAWMRAEANASRDVYLYTMLAKEKGSAAALQWFLDGAGYALAARAWVPFVSPRRAFILYACWEQANLHGNTVTLESLTDDGAVIRLTSLWFKLYEVSGHLRQQITFEDYQRIFQARWQDRASHAGWNLDITYSGADVRLHFRRAGGLQNARARLHHR